MPLSAGDRLGSYEIVYSIGKGGMGEVWKARDPQLGRDVAIKVSAQQFTDRFEREARAIAALNHANVCTLYHIGPNYLVMEYIEGTTLAERIKEGPIPLEEALAIAKQIADALEAAHEKSIVHRDLKPANVKIRPDGSVKVLDFGLAKAGEAQEVTADSPTMMLGTQAGLILGTAGYMSPEQARGKEVDKRADIWAFGVVLYEMVTGKRLFEGETVSDSLAAVLTLEPDLTHVPAKVHRLLRRCLEKDPRKRLRDIGEAQYLWDDSIAATHFVPSRSVRFSKGFRLATYEIAGVLLVALAAVSFFHFRHAAPLLRTLRYTIDLPENSALHSFALSPDGHYLAVATSVKGKRQLWLRPLDGLQSQPMPNTEDARYPFWSPDNRYIGFFAQGKLRKIAAIGGQAKSLCDVADGRGGSWNSDDVIVFSPNGGTESLIQRVSASGGVPSDVSKVRTRHLFPVFLPDGRHFLYETAGAGERDGIYVESLDGKEDRRILLDPSGVEFAPSKPGSRAGHLLFLRENNLMAQPFDAASLQATGEVFPVAEGVALANANNFAPVTASVNGLLLYWTGGGGATGAAQQIVWYDRNGRLLGTLTAPDLGQGPAISPDEKMIAFARQGTGARIDIWLRDLARGTDRRFTSDSSQNDNPIWSPQGERIVFDSDRDGHSRDLYQKKINGAGQDEVLLSTSYPKFVYQWSRDGRFIVYDEGISRRHLWVLPMADSGRPKPMQFLHTEFNEVHGQLSPDNRWMAYASDVSGQREVYARTFPSADREIRISIAGGEQPRWRGDGKELFYVAADRKIYAVGVKVSGGQDPVLEAGTPVLLFDPHFTGGVTDYFNYDVTSDGKRFLAASIPTTDSAPTISPPLTVVVNWKASSTK
jgi:serine/threonine protein kinase